MSKVCATAVEFRYGGSLFLDGQMTSRDDQLEGVLSISPHLVSAPLTASCLEQETLINNIRQSASAHQQQASQH